MQLAYQAMLFPCWTGICRQAYRSCIPTEEYVCPNPIPAAASCRWVRLPSLAETLRTSYDAQVLPDGPERTAFLAEHGATIAAVVTSGRTGVDAELMSALPNLGAVVNFGVGYDTTDVEAAAARGVMVSNTPDVLSDCVADTAVGLLIDTMRQFSAADRYLRAGRWPADGNYPLTHKVSGARVGIIGLGRIGTAIATRLVAFGCPISYHNRREIADSPYQYVSSPVDLAHQVDVLIIAAAGGSGTRHLVDRDVLGLSAPTATWSTSPAAASSTRALLSTP